MDITIKITDRDGVTHEVQAPTDMSMNIMELCRVYELAPEGTIGICGGMAMCASCQCYVLNDVELPEMSADEDAMLPWTVGELQSLALSMAGLRGLSEPETTGPSVRP